MFILYYLLPLSFFSASYFAKASAFNTSPDIFNSKGTSISFNFTYTVLSKGPAAAALKPAFITLLLPFAIGCSGLVGVVQPQEADAFSIIAGLSEIFWKPNQ